MVSALSFYGIQHPPHAMLLPHATSASQQASQAQWSRNTAPVAPAVVSFGWTPAQAETLAKATNPLHKLVVGLSMALENIVHLLTSAVKNLGKALGWVKNTTQHFEGQETLQLPTGQSPLQHATAIGSMLMGHSLASKLENSTAGTLAFPQLRNALTKLAKGTPEATPNLPASVVTLATDQPALADAAIGLLHQATGGKHPVHTLDVADHATPEALKQAFVDLSAKVAKHNPEFASNVVVLKNVGLTHHTNNPELSTLYDTLVPLLTQKGTQQQAAFEALGLKLPNQLLVTHLEQAPPPTLTPESLTQLNDVQRALHQWQTHLTQSPFEAQAVADAVLPLPLPLPITLPTNLGNRLNTPA